MDQKLYDSYVKILKNELVPALGCTEPIAIAYAAAKAHEVLGQMPEKIELCCSGNIIKNVKGVKVPNSNGLKGIDVAATLGVVGGRADRELEVLEDVTEADIEKTKELVQQGFCTCTLKEGVENLYIVAKVIAGEHSAEVTIVNRHTLISRIVKDGEVLYQIAAHEDSPEYVDKSVLNVKDILEFADTVKIEDVKDILDRQITMNSAISDEGLNHPYGAQVGRTLLNDYGNDVKIRARARAAAGSDARMSGCELPVVINSGSGNQGITCSVPVIEYAKELCSGDEKMYRALTLSNLVAIHQKTGIGRLSAFCGAVCAGVAAGAGIAYLRGGGFKEIAHTVVNGLAIVSGIVCDGAKPSCAAKIAASVNAGILGYEMYVRGQQFYGGDGLVTKGADNTIRNIGRLGKEGMAGTNDEIIKIMIE